jgi:hypothetical protein
MIDIVVSRYKKNTDWVEKFKLRYSNIDVKIYDKENPNNPYNVPINKGNEASVYLKYILDNYDNLPDKIFFIHDDEYSWHHSGSIVDLLQEAINMNLPYYNVNDRGYFDSDVTNHEEYLNILNWWKRYLQPYCPIEKLPNSNWFYGYRCSAQFLVDKSIILKYPRIFYQELYNWILDGDYGKLSGYYFEWTWHVFWDIYPKLCKNM